MKTLPDFFQLETYHISPADVTRMAFRCIPEAIHADVILFPWWQPEIFSAWAERITTITPDILYEVLFEGKPISVIRSGIGAPQAGDAVLALGCTACARIVFAGSVGGLHPEMQIGDLMLPEFSYAGDGFCRYLEPDFPHADSFLERVFPDEALALAVSLPAARLAREAGVALHTGPVFCTDSILAQFDKLNYMVNELGCIGIEMETAAVFKAARRVGIQAAALFSVSDVPVRNQSLFSGRSEAEQNRRKEIRDKVLARALLESLCR